MSSNRLLSRDKVVGFTGIQRFKGFGDMTTINPKPQTLIWGHDHHNRTSNEMEDQMDCEVALVGFEVWGFDAWQYTGLL